MPKLDLSKVDTSDTGGLSEEHANGELLALKERLADLQERFFAQASHALLIVLQGMDGSGKDSVISELMRACDPAGLRVYNFKKPSDEEAAHDFLWRFHKDTPAKGMIHVFDRSHYEEVIFPRVHDLLSDEHWKDRRESINDFERMLEREGTVIVKCLLHVDKDVQGERIRARLEEREEQHNFSANDVKERQFFDGYMEAYQDVLEATNTDWAPWTVVPADHKWFVPVGAGRAIVGRLEALDPQFPEVDPSEVEEAGLEVKQG